MHAAHVLGVLPEDGRLQVRRADQVVRHHQEPLPLRPAVVARDDLRQLRNGAGGRMTLQQQRQHCHEVALAAAETAVQIARLAAPGLHPGADQRERLIKASHQLWRDHVAVQRRLGMRNAFGELEHEVALVHALRDADDFCDLGHGRRLFGFQTVNRRRIGAGGNGYSVFARIAARTAPGGSQAMGDFLKSLAFRVTIQSAFTLMAHAVWTASSKSGNPSASA